MDRYGNLGAQQTCRTGWILCDHSQPDGPHTRPDMEVESTSQGNLLVEASYRAEIFELTGTSPRSWSLEVEPTAEGFFTLGIPAGTLAAGRYRIEISAAGAVVAEYQFQIGE